MRELQNWLRGPNVMLLRSMEFFAGPHNLLGLRGPAKNPLDVKSADLGTNGVLQFPLMTHPQTNFLLNQQGAK